jgi:hypothetical protein
VTETGPRGVDRRASGHLNRAVAPSRYRAGRRYFKNGIYNVTGDKVSAHFKNVRFWTRSVGRWI